MGPWTKGLYAMGYLGIQRYDFNGMVYSLPKPVIILVVVIFVMATFGMLSRFKDIFKGKGTALDFIGVLVLLVLFVLVALIIGSGVLKSISIF